MRRDVRCACALALVPLALAARALPAQQATPALAWTGTARVGLAGSYLFSPDKILAAQASYAPFLTDYLQVGVGVSHLRFQFQQVVAEEGQSTESTQTLRFTNIEAFANLYLPLTSQRLRPYVGGYYLHQAMTDASGVNVFGGQAGVSYFLSRFSALRGELQYRKAQGESDDDWAIAASLDPYLFGLAAEEVPTTARSGSIETAFDATHHFGSGAFSTVSLLAAPFVADWVQTGGSIGYTRAGNTDGTSTSVTDLTGFLNVFYQTHTRFLPYLGGFVGTTEYSSGENGTSIGNVGGQLGVKYFLSSGVALDLNVQARHFSRDSFSPLAAGLTTTMPRGKTQINIGLTQFFGLGGDSRGRFN